MTMQEIERLARDGRLDARPASYASPNPEQFRPVRFFDSSAIARMIAEADALMASHGPEMSHDERAELERLTGRLDAQLDAEAEHTPSEIVLTPESFGLAARVLRHDDDGTMIKTATGRMLDVRPA